MNTERATARASTLNTFHPRAACTHVKEKGVGLALSLVVDWKTRRTIAGAERRRQLRSMLFLGFWNSRLPLSLFSSFFFLFYNLSFSFPSFSSSSPSFLYIFSALSLFSISYLFIGMRRTLLHPAVNVPNSHRSTYSALFLLISYIPLILIDGMIMMD